MQDSILPRWGLALLFAWTLLGCDEDQIPPPPPVSAWDVGSSTNPAVVIDDSGNALAVWTQYDGVGSRLWANYFRSGASWEGPTLLKSKDASAYAPEVAMAPGGEAIVMWGYYDDCCDAWARYFTPDSGWHEPERIEDSRGDELAMGATGEAMIVWTGEDQSSRDHQVIWANRFTPEGGWTGPELVDRVESENGGFAYLDLEVNAGGIAVLAWSRIVFLDVSFEDDGSIVVEGEFELGVNRFTAETGWESNQQLDDQLSPPDIALDSQGNAVVVWDRSNDGRRNVWSNHFEPTVGWGEAESLNSDEDLDSDYLATPKIAMNASGTAMAVWIAEGFRGVSTSRYAPDTGWGPAGVLENEMAQSVSKPRIAVDSSGDAVAVWLQRNIDRRREVWASRFAADRGWEEAERINSGEGDADEPQIAMDPSGNASVVWYQSDGPRFSIRSNHFTPDQGWGSVEVIDEAP